MLQGEIKTNNSQPFISEKLPLPLTKAQKFLFIVQTWYIITLIRCKTHSSQIA